MHYKIIYKNTRIAAEALLAERAKREAAPPYALEPRDSTAVPRGNNWEPQIHE